MPRRLLRREKGRGWGPGEAEDVAGSRGAQGLEDHDASAREMSPEVCVQLPGPAVCQAVCGRPRQENEKATGPLSFGRAGSCRGSRQRLVNRSLHMQSDELSDVIKLLNEGS